MMTKAEQARLVAWRLRILQHAASEHRHIAQQTSSKPDGDAAIYADYHSTTMTLRQQHMQALAEIDERYAEARRQYGEENIRRAQALPGLNRADHDALAEKDLKGVERQAEVNRIQAEHRKRRAEYAEWRDKTASQLRDEHGSSRSAEISRHRAAMDSLLADRNAKLFDFRAHDGSIGLTPGAPGDVGPSGAEPPSASGNSAADTVESESDDAEYVGEPEMLTRTDDEQATVRTADDTSGSGGEDAGGSEVLTRVTETPSDAAKSSQVQKAKIRQMTKRYCQTLDIRAFHNSWTAFLAVQSKSGLVSTRDDSIEYLQELSSVLSQSPTSADFDGRVGDDKIDELISLMSTVKSPADAGSVVDRAVSHLVSVRPSGELRGEAGNNEDAIRSVGGALAIAAAITAASPSTDQPIVSGVSAVINAILQVVEQSIHRAREDGSLSAGKPAC